MRICSAVKNFSVLYVAKNPIKNGETAKKNIMHFAKLDGKTNTYTSDNRTYAPNNTAMPAQ